jgi:nucleoside-diphosphate-sugar epimerase
VGYSGKTVWDTSKPDGQPRRCLDSKAAKQALDWQAETKLRDGLEKTVKWYLENA